MTTLQVPVLFSEPPSLDRLSEIVEALGDHAVAEMTFTGGVPTVEAGEPTVVRVNIDDPSAVGIQVSTNGPAPTHTEAAERVVIRALLDAGHTASDARVDRHGITLI